MRSKVCRMRTKELILLVYNKTKQPHPLNTAHASNGNEAELLHKDYKIQLARTLSFYLNFFEMYCFKQQGSLISHIFVYVLCMY